MPRWQQCPEHTILHSHDLMILASNQCLDPSSNPNAQNICVLRHSSLFFHRNERCDYAGISFEKTINVTDTSIIASAYIYWEEHLYSQIECTNQRKYLFKKTSLWCFRIAQASNWLIPGQLLRLLIIHRQNFPRIDISVREMIFITVCSQPSPMPNYTIIWIHL